MTYADFSYAVVEASNFSWASVFRARFHKTHEDGAVFTNRSLALGDDEELARAEEFVAQP